jgi:hypothetical protein
MLRYFLCSLAQVVSFAKNAHCDIPEAIHKDILDNNTLS